MAVKKSSADLASSVALSPVRPASSDPVTAMAPTQNKSDAATNPSPTLPPRPLASAAGTGADRVKVTWGEVPGATGYKAFKCSASGGAYTAAGATSALSLNVTGLQAGKTYFFKVMPYRRIYTTNYYGPLSGWKAGTTE